MHNTLLEISISGLQLLSETHVALGFPKKRRLGPKNGSGSLGPKKLQKTVNCATNKETEKLKETMVGFQME